MRLNPGDHDRLSEILPHLCVGSYGAAEQAELLASLGITHAICLIEEIPEPVAALPHLHLPISDHGESDLREALATVVPFIESAREAGGRVLIFCALGVNRSPAVTAGYLRAVLGCSAEDAIAKIRSSRPFISIHHKYLSQLSGDGLLP
jgi:protein-tyrosine phosphatase